MIVKIEYFRQTYNELLGGEPFLGTPWKAIYKWMIWQRSGDRMLEGIATDVTKLSIDDYHTAAWDLASRMMDMGFIPGHAIPLDPNGELLDGSHRLAAAIAGGAREVYAERHAKEVWAPAWDIYWFEDQGLKDEYIKEIVRLYEAYSGRG